MTERRVEDRTHAFLLASLAAALLLMPFVTTFDDLLTAIAMRSGLDHAIGWVVPTEARMVVALLSLARVGASSHGADIVLAGHLQPMLISWNCIGWQSLVLLGLSCFTGLRGELSREARLQVILLGVLGTVIVNLVRVAMVVWLAAVAGYEPSVLFHDYGGTLMVIAWLFAFWVFAHRWVLDQAWEAG
jgi:exosortase/archaeosortase family protein